MKAFLPLTLALLLGPSAAARQPDTAALNRFFDALARHDALRGTVAVRQGGALVYQRSVGAWRAGQEEAPDTVRYRVGSITKLFTATLVFRLIEEGRLSLATPLADYFPDLPHADSITIDRLLAHRSGLYDFVNEQRDLDWLREPRDTAAILRLIRKRGTGPGLRFSYSNSGYWLLARIIERVTGQPYAAVVEQQLCAPLGLRHTGVPGGTAAGEALPYARSGAGWAPIRDFDFANVSGVGDLLSTPADLARFDEALCSGQLLRPATLQAMQTVVDPPFGRGAMRMQYGAHAGWGHGGDTYGTHSWVLSYPDDSLTVAFCLNGEDFPRRGILTALLASGYGDPVVLPDLDAPLPARAALDRYAGQYASATSPVHLALAVKRGRLVARIPGRKEAALRAVAPAVFVLDPSGLYLHFDPDGRALVLNGGTGVTRLRRVD